MEKYFSSTYMCDWTRSICRKCYFSTYVCGMCHWQFPVTASPFDLAKLPDYTTTLLQQSEWLKMSSFSREVPCWKDAQDILSFNAAWKGQQLLFLVFFRQFDDTGSGALFVRTTLLLLPSLFHFFLIQGWTLTQYHLHYNIWVTILIQGLKKYKYELYEYEQVWASMSKYENGYAFQWSPLY